MADQEKQGEYHQNRNHSIFFLSASRVTKMPPKWPAVKPDLRDLPERAIFVRHRQPSSLAFREFQVLTVLDSCCVLFVSEPSASRKNDVENDPRPLEPGVFFAPRAL